MLSQWRHTSIMAYRSTSNFAVCSSVCSMYIKENIKLSVTALCEGNHHWPADSTRKGSLMPQSHPTTGPVRFLSPVRFLARKAEWSARRNFTSVLFPWSHQATGPVRLDTSAYLWFGWIIRRTPRVPRAMPVRSSYGPARESSMFFISYGTRTGPVRDPQGCRAAPLRTRKGIDTTVIDKNPARASYLAVRAPQGLFTGCLQYQNPYGARELIMHAVKLHGPRTGRQNSYDAARGPWVDVRFLFKTAREQPVRCPGVWCDWCITRNIFPYHDVIM